MQPIEDSVERELMKRMKNHVRNIVIILVDGYGNREMIADDRKNEGAFKSVSLSKEL